MDGVISGGKRNGSFRQISRRVTGERSERAVEPFPDEWNVCPQSLQAMVLGGTLARY